MNYEYRPPKDGGMKTLVFLLLICSIIIFAASAAMEAYAGLLELGAVILAAAGLLLGTRYLMTDYIYAVGPGDGISDRYNGHNGYSEYNRYDLTITECRGRKRRVVCRVSVNEGKLEKITPNTPKPKGIIFNYCTGIHPANACYYFPGERDGGGVIKFSPDDTLIRILGGEQN